MGCFVRSGDLLISLLNKISNGEKMDSGEMESLRLIANQLDVLSGWVNGNDLRVPRGTFKEIFVPAGEVRLGTNTPGNGFSGVRLGYPPFVYNNENWNIAGVEDDKLQFGLNSADGKAYAGGGSIIIDGVGIRDTDGNVSLDSYAYDGLIRFFFGTLSIKYSNLSQARYSYGIHTFSYSTGLNLITTNPGFETGDFTGWTVSGSPTIVTDSASGKYAAALSSSGTIAVTVTVSSTYAWFEVTARVKLRSGGSGVLNVSHDGTSCWSTNPLTENWSTISYLIEANGDSTPTFIFYPSSSDIIIDDIEIKSISFWSSLGGGFFAIPQILTGLSSDTPTYKNSIQGLQIEGGITTTFGSNKVGAFKGITLTLADDTVSILDIPSLSVAVITVGNARYCLFHLDVGFNAVTDIISTTDFAYTTGVLSGTTGTDGKINLSCDSGFLYIENRSGATITNFTVTLI